MHEPPKAAFTHGVFTPTSDAMSCSSWRQKVKVLEPTNHKPSGGGDAAFTSATFARPSLAIFLSISDLGRRSKTKIKNFLPRPAWRRIHQASRAEEREAPYEAARYLKTMRGDARTTTIDTNRNEGMAKFCPRRVLERSARPARWLEEAPQATSHRLCC